MADDVDPDALVTYLKALASPRRLEIIRFLDEPHYVEEIASELGVARQTAREHLDQLVEAGFLERVPGERETGSVTDYAVVPQRLFSVVEELRALTGLVPEAEAPEGLRRRTEPLEAEAPAGEDADLPRLVVVHGLRVGRTTRLEGEGPWQIGRDPNTTLTLDYDPFVSSQHAEIRRVDGGFEVQDLYSSNGTFLDWEKLPRGGAREVDDGNVVRIGRSLVLFRSTA